MRTTEGEPNQCGTNRKKKMGPADILLAFPPTFRKKGKGKKKPSRDGRGDVATDASCMEGEK